jgi:hypothetical protein
LGDCIVDVVAAILNAGSSQRTALAPAAVPTLSAEIRLEPDANRFVVGGSSSLNFDVWRRIKCFVILGHHVLASFEHLSHFNIVKGITDTCILSSCKVPVSSRTLLTFYKSLTDCEANRKQSDRFHRRAV